MSANTTPDVLINLAKNEHGNTGPCIFSFMNHAGMIRGRPTLYMICNAKVCRATAKRILEFVPGSAKRLTNYSKTWSEASAPVELAALSKEIQEYAEKTIETIDAGVAAMSRVRVATGVSEAQAQVITTVAGISQDFESSTYSLLGVCIASRGSGLV